MTSQHPLIPRYAKAVGAVAVSALLIAGSASASALADGSDSSDSAAHAGSKQQHVLLLSVDGLHQKDLDWYVKAHRQSAFATLVGNGTSYTHAQTPVPSDSFTGLVGQVTGGNPGTTGIYYDDSYNRALLPAGTTNCASATPGAEVAFTEDADMNPHALDAGAGLAGLPGSILSLTGHPETLLNPATLPVDPKTCTPVYPHQYLKVNTIFEVAKAAGLTTAWSDKHPAYEILNGPSGTGVDDLFTPEINSKAPASFGGSDWTKNNLATQQYDGYKVQAVLNEIGGTDHSGTVKRPVPAIFGMNFQSVSTAEKLPTSNGLTGGYLPGGAVPGPLLSKALDYVDASLGRLQSAIASHGLAKNTTIILSAKHGQSPTDPAALVRVPDAPIIDGLNAAWKVDHPAAADLVVFSTNDDVMQLWLSDHSAGAAAFAKTYLGTHSAAGNTITGAAKTVAASGLNTIYAGAEVAQYFGTSESDARYPDIFGLVTTGVVYTGGKSKIAEHGGASADDRDVPLVVSTVDVSGDRDDNRSHTVDSAVETTQIAPTILKLLGLDPKQLQAVRIEGTDVLPRH